MDHKSYYQNKNVLVLGASFGIGEELCHQLSSLGANLAIVARSKDKIANMRSAFGTKNHLAFACDTSKKSDLDGLFSSLTKKWNKIDFVIFCVGIYHPMGINNFELDKAKQIVDVNLNSIFNFIASFLPYLKLKKIGSLAIISSVAGYFGMPNSLAYGASKAALSHLSESLFHELSIYNTKVKLISPGFVKTRLTAKNDFKMPSIILVSKAAKIILKKLPNKSFEIKFPFMFTFLAKLLSIMPYKIRFLLFRRYGQ